MWGLPVPTLPSIEELRQQQLEGQATNDNNLVHQMDLQCRQCIKEMVHQMQQVREPDWTCQLTVHSDTA